MQAEHQRGSGFIISPLNTPVPVSRPRRTLHFPTVDLSFLRRSIERVTGLFVSWRKGFLKSSAAYLQKIIFAVVAVCAAAVFFEYFTLGTAIYHNGKRVATVPDNKSLSAALLMAENFATEHNVTGLSLSFESIPTISLKSSITYGETLRNSLLLCSPSFSDACTLFSGDTAVFTAENEEIAKEISKAYLEKFSVNGDASFAEEIRFEKGVVPRDKILGAQECAMLLSESGTVSVVSTVKSTENKEIPYEIKTEQDSELYIGESVVVAEGKTGSARVNYEKTYRNGTEEAFKVLNESVVAEPVAALVRVGTKPKEILKTGALYPLEGVLSSPFGQRWGRVHEGIDIAVAEGTPVLAAECGTVVHVNENSDGYGKLIKIDHGYGVITAYAHLKEIQVYEGQVVNSKTQIALSGNTGRSTGPHLHFEIVKNGTPLNPLDYLRKR